MKNMKMRVALFTDTYLPNADGVVSSLLTYRKGLREAGHDMVVFAPELPGGKPEAEVYRYKSVPFPPYPDYRVPFFPNVHRELLIREGIGIIHCKAMATMGVAARALAKKTKLPSVASLETMIPDGTHYLFPIHGKFIEGVGRRVGWSYLRWFYSGFDLATAPSHYTQKLMAENGIESITLPSPIDTGRFKPNRNGADVRRLLGIGRKKVIATVGRIVKEKNYDFLLRVAERTRDWDALFLVVGKGPYLAELKHKARLRGIVDRFLFAGFVPDSDLVDHYNAADCFVFPSRFETQGLVALEALSCGKPVCVMGNTPMQELVTHGKNGFVFHNEEECAEQVIECADNAKGMASASRQAALPYAIDVCTKRLLRLYRQILG